MPDRKRVLEKRLETVNKQITSNVIIGIIAILVLIFVPWIQFENFMFRISLETIIAFVVLIVSLVRGFTLRGKKEEIESELSVYSNEEHKEEKIVEKKEIQKYTCEYCEIKKDFKSLEALETHYLGCKEKRYRSEKDKKIAIWVIGVIAFLSFGIYFLINNKINLIPLILIGFILTPFFDKTFNNYKKKNKKLKHFMFNWWKKGILVVIIILLFFVINLAIPNCPKSCDDTNSCTEDFCSSGTGFKCMNTVKLNCQGNNICEEGEYGTSDCPNCDDSKKCTVDSYDYGARKCINVKMKGCVE
ncbi:MAG: hypothetical protein KKA62_04365 [Nanoarchaeota archaeon]|nr:hypothetical protein [Nanoarchaeota archaeon]MBU1643918.1 hypothetical protein [Nanoarchaeota archaeon]MBU1977154.1 hypothetical protein [Nanoarchaeota archaeon]